LSANDDSEDNFYRYKGLSPPFFCPFL
jgi:hypothetical protein